MSRVKIINSEARLTAWAGAEGELVETNADGKAVVRIAGSRLVEFDPSNVEAIDPKPELKVADDDEAE